MPSNQGNEARTSFTFFFFFLLSRFSIFIYSVLEWGQWQSGGVVFFYQRRNTWAIAIDILFEYLIFVSPALRIGWTVAMDEGFSGREAQSS
jgi:hypothetical protein